MNAKIPKTKQKIADITPPSKGVGTAVPQIVIEKRAHLERPEGPGADSVAAGAPPAPTQTSMPTTTASPTPTATLTPTPTPAGPTQVQTSAAPKRTVITPPEDTKADATEAPSETPETKASPTPASSIDTDIDEEPDATDTPSDAVNDIKAAKEAEAAARREGELEKFIDTKQFFVPINKEAQKRSLKVTLWLTALYIVLSLMLVNLMLDTGMILLLQKLPHTNFFSV